MPSYRHASPRRRNHHRKSISTPDRYRLVITWPGQNRTTHYSTSDLAQARGIARRNSQAGAVVQFQEHQEWGRFVTTRVYQPVPELRRG